MIKAGGKDSVITAESNAEPYMDEVHGYLSLWANGNGISERSRDVPAFPAIYGGYYNSFGGDFWEDDLKVSPWIFSSKIA